MAQGMHDCHALLQHSYECYDKVMSTWPAKKYLLFLFSYGNSITNIQLYVVQVIWPYKPTALYQWAPNKDNYLCKLGLY